MNGAEVLLFTMANVPNGVKALLKKAGLEFEDIDYFLFHQASTIVLDNIQRKLNILKKNYLEIIEILAKYCLCNYSYPNERSRR